MNTLTIAAVITLREMNAIDLPAIYHLLAGEELRTEGILVTGTRYWGAFVEDQLVGMIGCEYGNGCGLLRSALVRPEWRSRSIGRLLTERLLNEARLSALRTVYLFSTGAGAYWRRLGFCEVPVAQVVSALPEAPQVKLFERLGWLPTEVAYGLCPA
ncbi:MAG: GNAT family N-acetyltransferase [Chloroflexi bacterium]|jgi:N-acetylglutamate synthase-like GNAT family acetyltransferase|nr:GNAT family N-acetyltransferase [Anaerolineaceae bacterium]NMB89351.1 GNAT family N-acetyltransferase [Chloroflexota bacterium]